MEMTKCTKCEESISVEESETNQGLCNKCYKRLKLLEEMTEPEIRKQFVEGITRHMR